MFKLPSNVLNKVKKYLENKQKETERRLTELKKEDPFSDPSRLSDKASSDTEAKEEFGHDTISAIAMELSKALVRIRKALTKIKIGKYGVCEKCKKMIDTDRLAIMPTAEFCVNCERKNEK